MVKLPKKFYIKINFIKRIIKLKKTTHTKFL